MDKYILVQHSSSINSVINETFKYTQRIKLTCCDISEDFIVFGASSGGIYIFRREPCEFIKLIPSKEGSAIKIVISLNGKNLAIASSKGFVIILEDFLDPNVRPLICSEHENSTVTAIRWHGNAIYSGDVSGRVAVFFLSNLLTIFQTPSATLMHLDSSIVQIDSYLNYLLISTKTRTYLCDTEKECYKQIGRKLRDGYFGACFFNVSGNDSPEVNQGFKGIFKTIKDDENFITNINNSDVKIYCSRPGARLWEANFEATVLVTHQFRDSFSQGPSELLHLKNNADARMNVSTFTDVSEVPKNFSFCNIYPMLCRFIVTYDNNGVYIFDPTTSKLAFWSNCFKNIKQITILGSVIYIWQDTSQINVISIELLEQLIIKALFNKQYYFCAELCNTYHENVINLIEYSNKIHLISILKSKLIESNATEMLEKITPILETLEKFNKKQIAGKKLANGIVAIENPHNENLDYDNVFIPESVRNFKTDAENVNYDVKEAIKCNETEDCTNSVSYQDSGGVEKNTDLLALKRQFQLNKTHKNAELTEANILLNKLGIQELFKLFQDFVKYVEHSENMSATSWCKQQFLKYASKRNIDLDSIDENIVLLMHDGFLELCSSTDLNCKCNFPLPKAHKKRPEYYDLGCKLMKCEKDTYLANIPYMYKYILKKPSTSSEIFPNLPLIVQFNDVEVFEQYLTLFTYDIWDEIITLYTKLSKGQCLNCGQSVDVGDDVFSWTNLGMLMIRSIGPQNTTRLLKRHSENIPTGSLDTNFYQCCILATTLDEPDHAVNFMDNILTENILPKFEDQMEKFLQKRYLGCQNQPIKCSSTTDVDKCASCDTPFRGPIFSDRKQCDHGHNFHSLCFARNNGICSVCSNT